MVVHAGHRHAALPHGLDEHAEPGEVRDVEHDDQIGTAKLFHSLTRSIDAGQVIEEEAEAGRRGARIGDNGVDALGPEQVHQPDLAADPVAVGIYVGGDAHPLPWLERGGELLGQGGLLG